ncbi:MAG: chromate efflux transporter [Chroococcidiopsidaceae cyanobacterium CP_BM_ER_R8_30]|nr:chromate efflux transporter [Chroococcidiopsidaceae cyanobacterium CP_BM_ER_R8_30]
MEQTINRLAHVALPFLKLGTIAFGGPAAHIAMMEDEFVRRRRWLEREQFLDLLGITNLIPGPSSTEMAIYIAYLRAGLAGLIVGGSCFILPAALIVGVLAWVYVSFGKLSLTTGVLYGVKPVVIAIILQALWRLGRTAVKTQFLALIGLLAVGLTFLGGNALIVLFGTGAISGIKQWLVQRGSAGGPLSSLLITTPLLTLTKVATTPTLTAPKTVTLLPLFLVFLKVGAVVFGSGYVLLAFLQDDLVTQRHWLSDAQLLDAIAIGQVTPGPVFTTATFIGYILAGIPGAIIATVGIFLPGFLFVALCRPVVAFLRQSPIAGAFLDGINVAALALMIVVTKQLAVAALINWLTVLLALASLVLLIRFCLNSVWLVLFGAIIGLGTSALGMT